MGENKSWGLQVWDVIGQMSILFVNNTHILRLFCGTSTLCLHDLYLLLMNLIWIVIYIEMPLLYIIKFNLDPLLH